LEATGIDRSQRASEHLSGFCRIEGEQNRIIGIRPRLAFIRCFRHAANRSGARVESSRGVNGDVLNNSAAKSITLSEVWQRVKKHHDP
jgi:hypothetical protein